MKENGRGQSREIKKYQEQTHNLSQITRNKLSFVPVPEKLQQQGFIKVKDNIPTNKHQVEEQQIQGTVQRYLPFFKNLSSTVPISPVQSPEYTKSPVDVKETKISLLDQLYSFSSPENEFKFEEKSKKTQKISSTIIELSRVEQEAKRVGLNATTLNLPQTIQQLTKKRINEIKEQEKDFMETADICFLMDLSFAMKKWKDQVFNAVMLLVSEILQKYTYRFKVNFSIVGYYEQSNKNCLIFPFTDDAPSLLDCLFSLECSENSGLLSNVFDGLKEVIKLDWNSPLRLLYFFPVSPCVRDLDSNSIIRKYLKQMTELRIRIYFTEINYVTDTMLQNFVQSNRDINSQYSIESLKIDELHGSIARIFGAYVPPVVVPVSPVFVTHVIFVIDISGSMSLSMSNEENDNYSALPEIDDDDDDDNEFLSIGLENSSKSRISAVFSSCIDFVKQQLQQANTANDRYSMILFHEYTFVPMLNQNLSPDLTETICCFKDDVRPEYGTVYSNALDEVYNVAEKVKSDFTCVIFLSDGLPEDKPETIDMSIVKLIDKFGLNIQLNTLQICDSLESNEILEKMAQQGRGVFLQKNLQPNLIRDGFVAFAKNLVNTRANIEEVQQIRPLKPKSFTINEAIPNFQEMKSESVSVFSMVPPKTIEEIDAMAIEKIESTIKQSMNPFSKGSQRLAYYMYDMKIPKQLMVKKTFLFDSTDYRTEFLRFLEEMEIHALAKFLAEKFNQVAHLQKKISFVDTYIYKLTGNDIVFSGEVFISGKYTRYTNNYGWVERNEPDINILVAFSHWTYEFTNETLMVVDLQGVGLNLTDPAIHCVHLFKYGKTNFGILGMAKFFQTHKCNDICKKLSLPKRVFSQKQIEEWEKNF